jgi:hypothetical protein
VIENRLIQTNKLIEEKHGVECSHQSYKTKQTIDLYRKWRNKQQSCHMHACGVVMPQQIFNFTTQKDTYFVANRICVCVCVSLSLSLFIYVILQPYLERKLGCRVLSNEERCSVHIYIYVCFHNRQPAENKVNGIRVFVLCVCVYICCVFVGCLLHIKQMKKISSSIVCNVNTSSTPRKFLITIFLYTH